MGENTMGPPAPDQSPPVSLELPGGSWWDAVGATINRGLNRWIDVEVYKATQGQPLPPGGQPVPAAAMQPQASWIERNWPVVAVGAVALVLLMRKA